MKNASAALLLILAPVLSARVVQPMQLPVSLKTTIGTLHGTLELPLVRSPVPVLLIIPGSGPTDRDGNAASLGLNTDCYKQLANALAKDGIASLRYDKRGAGEDAMLGLFENRLRFENFVADATGWGKQLRADRRFSVLVVIGHSEGSLIGMLAARKIPADGYVSIAGAGEPAQIVLLEQMKSQLPPDLYKESGTIIESLVHGKTIDTVPSQLQALFRPSVQPYLISWFRYEPTKELAKLRIPVLIVQGERDLQVNNEDARALAKAGTHAQLVLIPGMNHVLKDVGESREDNLAAYKDPSLSIDPQLVFRLESFIHHVDHTRRSRHGHS
jgi:uncharacterized protein